MAPELTTEAAIVDAYARVAPRLHRTPTVSSRALSQRIGAHVSLKLELFQKTGSFKPRGALNALAHLSEKDRRRGVVSMSAGNHAQALAWAARSMGVHATIVMPEKAVATKIAATRGYGGEVVLTAGRLMDVCLQLAGERGLTFVHPFDDPHVIAGAATVGMEIVEDAPDVDWVIVACGGGGLLSGVASAIKRWKDSVRVIGVEPEGARKMIDSLAAGTAMPASSNATIADGLAAPFAGALNLAHVQAFVDEMVTVSDAEIVDAMRLLMERAKIVPEPAGAAATAALLAGRIAIPAGARVVSIVSGGNVDLDRLGTLLGGRA